MRNSFNSPASHHQLGKCEFLKILLILLWFFNLFANSSSQECVGRVREREQSCGDNDICPYGSQCQGGTCYRYTINKYCAGGLDQCIQYNITRFGPRYPHLHDPGTISVPNSVVCVHQSHKTKNGWPVCVQRKQHYEKCEKDEECFSNRCVEESWIFGKRCYGIPIGADCDPTLFGTCDRGGYCHPDTKKCVEKMKIHAPCGDIYWKYHSDLSMAPNFADASLICGPGRICDLCPDKALIGTEQCKKQTCETYSSKFQGDDCSNTYVCRNDMYCDTTGKCRPYPTSYIPLLEKPPAMPCKKHSDCPTRFFCNCTDSTYGVCARNYNYENSADTLSSLVDCMVPRGNHIATLHRDTFAVFSSLNDLAWGCKYFNLNFICKAVEHPVESKKMFAMTTDMTKWCEEPDPYPTILACLAFFVMAMCISYCTFSAQVLYCIYYGRWERIFRCVLKFFWPKAFRNKHNQAIDDDEKENMINAMAGEMKESLLDAEHNPNENENEIKAEDSLNNDKDDETETETETQSAMGDEVTSSVADSSIADSSAAVELGEDGKPKKRHHKKRRHHHHHHSSSKGGDEDNGEENGEKKKKKRKHRHHHSKTPKSPSADNKENENENNEGNDEMPEYNPPDPNNNATTE